MIPPVILDPRRDHNTQPQYTHLLIIVVFVHKRLMINSTRAYRSWHGCTEYIVLESCHGRIHTSHDQCAASAPRIFQGNERKRIPMCSGLCATSHSHLSRLYPPSIPLLLYAVPGLASDGVSRLFAAASCAGPQKLGILLVLPSAHWW